jgi:hypothetical protein
MKKRRGGDLEVNILPISRKKQYLTAINNIDFVIFECRI